MHRIPKVNISMRELDRLKCIQGLIDKQIKQKAVAERLGQTVRHSAPPPEFAMCDEVIQVLLSLHEANDQPARA